MPDSLLRTNLRLIWLVDSIKGTLKGRTRKWLSLKFRKTLKELEAQGQEKWMTDYILREMKCEWPELEY